MSPSQQPCSHGQLFGWTHASLIKTQRQRCREGGMPMWQTDKWHIIVEKLEKKGIHGAEAVPASRASTKQQSLQARREPRARRAQA